MEGRRSDPSGKSDQGRGVEGYLRRGGSGTEDVTHVNPDGGRRWVLDLPSGSLRRPRGDSTMITIEDAPPSLLYQNRRVSGSSRVGKEVVGGTGPRRPVSPDHPLPSEVRCLPPTPQEFDSSPTSPSRFPKEVTRGVERPGREPSIQDPDPRRE